jgi:dUTP pyrophosphatase
MNFNIKLAKDAIMPARATASAAGYDLNALDACEIAPGARALIKTGTTIQIADGYYGRIAPRSGLAYKFGIHVMAGVIDSDYRGDIGVILYNSGNASFTVIKGDRIAQIIFERYYAPTLTQCDELVETARGAGGFGSTGTQ